MTHGPIQERHRATMNAVAEVLDVTFNGEPPPPPQQWRKPVAWVLLTAETGKYEGGRVNYISNGERADMVAMLRELLARFEGQPDVSGRA